MKGRLMLCAPSSGAGKTTVTCALLSALVQQGEHPVAFKSGPDYIDPMFHSQIIGNQSHNLDIFLMGESGVLSTLASCTPPDGLAVLEGAMGYYDGIAMGSDASAHHLATLTQTPGVLVVDGRGAALSVAAQIKGFLDFRTPSGICGVILNRISPMMCPRLKEVIQRELHVAVYGYLPFHDEFVLESRHLGLVTACEVEALQEKLTRWGGMASETLDIQGLMTLAKQATPLTATTEIENAPRNVSIAVAQDKAFCFYYSQALMILEKLGATLVPFSPLTDKKLPDGVQGLYLGGGYPELYAKELSQNQEMCGAIRRAIGDGMPTIAECGGFLYLHQTLEDASGVAHPMCGTIQGAGYKTDKLGRFGYVTLTTKEDGLLLHRGDAIPAHEFHYWESTSPGTSCHGQKPQSHRGWDAVHQTKTLYAGFPHLHLGGEMGTTVAQRFITACQRY